MNRIDKLFADGRRNVLTVYCTAGYPQLQDTVPVLQALQANGVDMIELGMPFSDPLADGPTIQESSRVALSNGMRIPVLFEQLARVRETVHVPLLLMGYVNPVLRYGVERFAETAARCGLDGVILPDLPLGQHGDAIQAPFVRNELHVVRMATTRTPKPRLRELAQQTQGFLYAVTIAGVTGATVAPSAQRAEALRGMADLPVPVLAGFGIHDAYTLHEVFACTHGAIVGSAYIRALAQGLPVAEATTRFIQQLQQPFPERS
jgi:tryptophan synthase alpha chain